MCAAKPKPMTERQQYLLHKYHMNDLSVDERKEFDAMLTDDAFRELVDLGSDLPEVLAARETDILRSKMQSWEDETKGGIKRKRSFYVILAILLLGLLALLWWSQGPEPKTVDPQMLYAENLAPYKNIYMPLERSKNGENQIEKAFAAYEAGQFAGVIELFNNIPDSARTDGIHFYHAVSLLMEKNKDAAGQLFDQISDESEFAVQRTWFQFLLALSNNDRSKIDTLGRQLTEQNTHPVLARDAQRVLDQLEPR